MSHRVLDDALLISELSVQERKKNREGRQGSVAVRYMVQKKSRVVLVCVIKASEGSRGMGPLILNLGTTWK